MKKITHVTTSAEGFDAHGLSDAGAKIKIPIRQVRCSVIPPMESSLSFYYLMLAQHFGENASGKEPLVFISEFAGESQEEFFRKLDDDVKVMRCKVIYADFKDQRAFYVSIHKRFSGGGVRIHPAPFASDIAYGKTLIREWLKDRALLIPKYEDTILKAELHKIEDDERSGKESLAFHALRFVLGGFLQDPPLRGSFSTGGRLRRDAGGWT